MQGGEHAPQEFPKVSSRIQENFRFLETRLGEQRISPLRARGGSEFATGARPKRQHRPGTDFLPNEALSAFKPYCPNPALAVPSFVEWVPLRTAITLLLATVPWSVPAQTAAPNENLLQLLSKLKTCVRENAPAAQTAGMQNTNDAIKFFIETCTPPLSVSALTNPGAAPPSRPGMLSQSDFANVGAVPPGIFRRVIGEEWASFVEETRTC
jgi:hypothetical protein